MAFLYINNAGLSPFYAIPLYIPTKKDIKSNCMHISVIYMKYRVILIVGLLILCFIVPAFADLVEPMDVMYSENRALSVRFEKVVESNTSDIFSPYKYPADQYEFITLYYSLYNPSDSDVYYEFNISVQDQANNVFTANDFILGETVPAHSSLQNRIKHYAVYSNSTFLEFVWTDKEPNPPWDHFITTIPISFVLPTPTPTALPTTAPTITPTPTPEPTPAQGPLSRCLPFMLIGAVIGGVGGMGLLTRRFRIGR